MTCLKGASKKSKIKMIKNKKIYSFIAFVVILVVYSSCAQVGRPEGGDKDEIPPVLESSEPENMTTNFTEKKIVLEFDENIQLKDLNKQLVISPPIAEKPEIKTNMNKLTVKFIDSLRSNTTYTLNFANAIADLNESNIYENYHYTFSTGSVIDSFQVNGQLLNAFDEEPIFGATVLLHTNLSDTAFLSEIPNYIAKTDSSGIFSIKHIAPGKYKLYALKEAQFNYTYEVNTEEGAFFPEVIFPEIEEILKIDTFQIIDTIIAVKRKLDSLNLEIIPSDSIIFDTIYSDSIVRITELEYLPKDIQIKMFMETAKNQFVEEKKREEAGKLEISFNLDIDSSFLLEALDLKNSEDWLLLEQIDEKNFIAWISDSSIYNQEDLRFLAHYQTVDSLQNPISAADTLSFKFYKDKEEEKVAELKININVNKKKIEIFEEVRITFSAPLDSFVVDSIKLYELKDTTFSIMENGREKTIKEKIEKPLAFTIQQDSLFVRQYNLYFDRKKETKYKIVIDTASISDIFENTNIDFKSEFQIQDSSFYGDIILNISNIDTFLIVQLLDSKKEILKEYFVSTDSAEVNFKFLAPESYFLKVIADKNNNKKWDTGNFKDVILPEKVYFYKEEIEIKAGWSNEIDWEINETNNN